MLSNSEQIEISENTLNYFKQFREIVKISNLIVF